MSVAFGKVKVLAVVGDHLSTESRLVVPPERSSVTRLVASALSTSRLFEPSAANGRLSVSEAGKADQVGKPLKLRR